ncbi:MAG: carboxypeptidase regulatory-like domain-containing protein [Vicinamibacterales bacterium]
MRRSATAFAFVLLTAITASAQTLFQGRIDVTVFDPQGAVVPGALVEITGASAQNQTSDEAGEAHFLNLPPGQYTVTSTLAGFGPARVERVAVAAGTAVPLRLTLQVGGVTEAVQVTAEPPVVDPGRQTLTTSVSFDELQRIPSARDPWVVLQSVPTVVVDRVNVGGAESGQQSNYVAKGASTVDNTWNLDGIPVTDLAATGSSPTYYNFDMFEEMSVTTGGASATNPTAGVQLNMQFKTGADRLSGAAHYYGAGESLQSRNLPDDLLPLAGASGKGNRIKDLSDVGFDLGGPVLRGKWWAWGSFGRTKSTLFTLNGDPDTTTLDNVAFKTSAQVTPSIRPEFLFFRGNKVKNGRGASPLRSAPTTWDQSGPTPLYKGQVNITAGRSVFVTARAGYVGNGFSLTPQGGLEVTAYRDASRVRRGSYVFYETDRPDRSVLADGTWFRGRHEVAFGGSWRKVRDDEHQEFPGSGVDNLHAANYATTGAIQAWLWRPFFASSELTSQSAYVGDTIRTGRLTTQLSLRYDRTSASMLESRQNAIPGFPDLLPAIVAPAEQDLIQTSLFSPRVGLSYLLDDSGRTVARASYGIFGTQIGAGTVQSFSAANQAILIYSAIDRNGNNVADPGELGDLLTFAGVDPDDPGAGLNFNRVDPDFTAPKTHEFVVGLDREVMRQLSVGASVTWRRFTDVIWSSVDLVAQTNVYPLVGLTRDDYAVEGVVQGSAPGLGAYEQPYYAPIDSRLPPGNGVEFRNRPDYHQTYLGFELQATKRLSNRWMGRVAFSTNRHVEHFDGPGAVQDPGATTTWPNIDGGAYVTATTGSGKSEIYLILPRYQLAASGLYQLPYGINVGANLVAREGYGTPYFETVESADPTLPEKRVLLVNPRDERLPGVATLDMRVEKAFALRMGEVSVTADVFNLFNASTVLGRQYDVTATGTTGFDRPLEIMNPRLLRFGVRWRF